MNELIFNGKSLSEFSAYVASSNFLDGAQKDVESIAIPGRSGELQLDNRRFHNMTIRTTVYITGNMQQNMAALRNYLNSCGGYCRYEESLDPDHYRMASFVSAFEPYAYDRISGAVTLEFNAYPQRWLKSGETPTDATPSSTTSPGSTVSVPNPSGLSSVSDLKVDINPVQEGSGDPSPTNIRPISGHTQATVYRVGKNLLPNNWVSRTTNGVTFTPQPNGRVRVYGTATDYTIYLDSFVWTGDTGVYYFNGCPDGSATTFDTFIYDNTNGQRARKRDGVTPCDSCYSGSQEVLLVKGTRYSYVIRVQSGFAMTQQLFASMIRRSADDAYYDQYNGVEYTIELGDTVYGGTLEVTTGVLTVDKGFTTVSAQTWTYDSTYTRFSTRITDLKTGLPTRGVTLLSSAFVTIDDGRGISAVPDNAIYGAGASNYVYIKTSLYTSASDFVNALGDAQIVYPLATPTTVQLTPQQVSLLQGSNYINASTGDVEITVSTPGMLLNPTLFESKPIIRMYGNGTVNIGNVTITVSNSPFDFVDLDCETMDAHYGSGNANPYISISTDDFITLKPGENYVTYSGFTVVRITPRWYEI